MSITAILNCYRRPQNIKLQVEALINQTVKPDEIWVWSNYHKDNEDYDITDSNISKIVWASDNFKYHGRFTMGLLARTDYLAYFDDDTVPGSRWLESCINLDQAISVTNQSPTIFGSAGVRFYGRSYIQHERVGWPSKNIYPQYADLVGHAWFFKKEVLRAFWSQPPLSLDNCEDLQLSFFAQKVLGSSTICPAHPPDDKSLWGSIRAEELGIDAVASSNNIAMSHKQFFAERDEVMAKALAAGWKTLRKI